MENSKPRKMRVEKVAILNEVTARIEFDLTDTIFDVRDRMVAAQ